MLKEEVTYLGHAISNGQVFPLESKFEAINNYAQPQSIKQKQTIQKLQSLSQSS